MQVYLDMDRCLNAYHPSVDIAGSSYWGPILPSFLQTAWHWLRKSIVSVLLSISAVHAVACTDSAQAHIGCCEASKPEGNVSWKGQNRLIQPLYLFTVSLILLLFSYRTFSSSKYSNAVWTGLGITGSVMLSVLKRRYVQLWKSLAFLKECPTFQGNWKLCVPTAKDMKCPLRGQSDSAGYVQQDTYLAAANTQIWRGHTYLDMMRP